VRSGRESSRLEGPQIDLSSRFFHSGSVSVEISILRPSFRGLDLASGKRKRPLEASSNVFSLSSSFALPLQKSRSLILSVASSVLGFCWLTSAPLLCCFPIELDLPRCHAGQRIHPHQQGESDSSPSSILSLVQFLQFSNLLCSSPLTLTPLCTFPIASDLLQPFPTNFHSTLRVFPELDTTEETSTSMFSRTSVDPGLSPPSVSTLRSGVSTSNLTLDPPPSKFWVLQ